MIVEIIEFIGFRERGISGYICAINKTQVEVTFSGEIKDVKPANFQVTDADGNSVFVSQVELNEAGNVVTLSFFDEFEADATYSVKTTGIVDAEGNEVADATNTFVYEAAEVASIEFSTKTLSTTKTLKDIITVKDELGRDVTEEVELTIQSSNTAVIDADGIAQAEGTSVVVIGVKGTDVKTTATVVTVKDGVATEFVGYYVYTSDAADTTEDFLELEADDKTTFVSLDDSAGDKKLALYYNDQYGNSLNAVESGFTVTNLTPSVVIVAANGEITPISEGTGYVKVKVADVEKTIAIDVRAKSVVSALEVDKTDITVVEEAAVGQKFEVTFKDQFDTKLTGKNAVVKVKDEKIAKVTPNSGTEFTVTGLAKGTTTIEVSYKVDANTTLTETVNVTVTEAGDFVGYEAVASTTTLDVDFNGDNAAENATNVADITVYNLDSNGNRVDTESAQLVAVDKDGKADSSIVKIHEGKVQAVKAGTGYVQVKVDTLVVDTIEFTVVDTTAVAKSVEFDRYDILKAVDVTEVGTIASAINIEDELEAILTIKDQYGNDVSTDPTIKFTVTNAIDLGVDNPAAPTEITNASATIDVVVTEIKDGGDNLISSPVVIKFAVEADGEQEATLKNTRAVKNGSEDGIEVAFNIHHENGASTPYAITLADVTDLSVQLLGENDVVLATHTATNFNENQLAQYGVGTTFFKAGTEITAENGKAQPEWSGVTQVEDVLTKAKKAKVSYKVNGITYTATINVTP